MKLAHDDDARAEDGAKTIDLDELCRLVPKQMLATALD